eukprot:6186748-Pleurochrysis_carterae.AAC.3
MPNENSQRCRFLKRLRVRISRDQGPSTWPNWDDAFLLKEQEMKRPLVVLAHMNNVLQCQWRVESN